MGAARNHVGSGKRDLGKAEVLPEQRKDGGVRVAVFGSTGAFMGEKVGFVSPDGSRCYVRLYGERVQATREGTGWMYRVPASEAA
jgi:hypothetical protein